jgi:galactokinase
MFESCESSRTQYECGSPELIALYEIARETPGIYGGRFSGAGFKGDFITLVDPTQADAIRARVTEQYLRRYPQYKDSFEIFFCALSNGVEFM